MVEPVPAAATYELRHRVLGRGQAPADLATDDDNDADSGHFACRIGGQVVATGTVRRRPAPDGTEPAWQVRGLAVEEARRGQGMGAAVLEAILDHVDAHGGGTVWCHARIAARTLYERHGFVAVGEPFDDPVAGRQLRMVRRPSGA